MSRERGAALNLIALTVILLSAACSNERVERLEARVRAAELEQAKTKDELRALGERWAATQADLADAAKKSRSATATLDAYLNTMSLPTQTATPQPSTASRPPSSATPVPTITPVQYQPYAQQPAQQQQSRPRADATAHDRCSAEWSSNDRMLAWCEDQAMRAKASIEKRTYTSTGMWPKQFDDMRRECQLHWPNDYKMQDWCEAQHAATAQKIGQTTGH